MKQSVAISTELFTIKKEVPALRCRCGRNDGYFNNCCWSGSYLTLWWMLCGLLLPVLSLAQETEGSDTLDVPSDTVPAIERRVVGVNRPENATPVDTVLIDMVAEDHSPRRAALLSAALPGLGQIYNKKYWKVPIIYAGFAILGYLVIWNNDRYQILRRARIAEENGQRDQNPLAGLRNGQFERADVLANQVDNYRQQRDQFIIYTIGFYGLNIMDAIVDAHLIEFDVNPDLSFKLEPTAGPRLAYNHPVPSLPYSGLALTLHIR